MKPLFPPFKPAHGRGKAAARCALFLAPAFLATTARAQWLSTGYTTYALHGGWNAIYLHGEATHATMEQLFAAEPEVQEVWRWNPNPTPVQFTADPQVSTPGKPEWSLWVRDGLSNSLQSMNGAAAYLVRCTGTATTNHSVNIMQRPVPPSAAWVRHGANLFGFPSVKDGGNYPLFTDYFATFPAAIAANTKIYEHIGGPLGALNPQQIFSPSSARVDRNKAYWFSAEVVENFYGRLEITMGSAAGLDFGKSGSAASVHVRNRSATDVTVTFAPVGTAAANRPAVSPATPAIIADVPLTHRVFNPGTLAWEDGSAAFSATIPANATVEFSFGINRGATAMTGASTGDFFASLLRVTETGEINAVNKPLMDVMLPVTANKGSLAGLWIGEALVSAVESKPQADAVTPTARPYPLRCILHVADDGTARLLSQVFLGKLAGTGNPVGLCTKEAGLLQTEKADAMRLVAVHMPLDRVLDGVADAAEPAGSGSVTPGQDLTRVISLPFNDPVNPFVHKYHPDHDNKAPDGTPLIAGQESYTVVRQVSFGFTATAAEAGSTSSLGWGSTVIGGTYAETIQGLHKDSTAVGTGDGLHLAGTFELRRVSDIGSITVNP